MLRADHGINDIRTISLLLPVSPSSLLSLRHFRSLIPNFIFQLFLLFFSLLLLNHSYLFILNTSFPLLLPLLYLINISIYHQHFSLSVPPVFLFSPLCFMLHLLLLSPFSLFTFVRTHTTPHPSAATRWKWPHRRGTHFPPHAQDAATQPRSEARHASPGI